MVWEDSLALSGAQEGKKQPQKVMHILSCLQNLFED